MSVRAKRGVQGYIWLVEVAEGDIRLCDGWERGARLYLVSGGSRETYIFVMAGRGVQGYTWLVEVAERHTSL